MGFPSKMAGACIYTVCISWLMMRDVMQPGGRKSFHFQSALAINRCGQKCIHSQHEN